MKKDRISRRKNNAEFPTIVNSYAAGIDLGSEFHKVCIRHNREWKVCEFGIYTENLHELATWLQTHRIQTVAMERRGLFWDILARILVSYNIEVLLLDKTRQEEKNSHVLNCMWLQYFHSLGLLRPGRRLSNTYFNLNDIGRDWPKETLNPNYSWNLKIP